MGPILGNGGPHSHGRPCWSSPACLVAVKHDWHFDDDLFERELIEGHKWATVVHERFLSLGLPSVITPYSMRQDVKDRGQWSDELDLHVGQYPVEVKSRRLKFTDPSSYPYGTAFVDTVVGWDRKPVKPLAVVLVSQSTSAMVVVSAKTEPLWRTQTAFDRVRGMEENSYACPKKLLLPFEALVEWLRERLDGAPEPG